MSVLTACFWLFGRFSLAHVTKYKLLSWHPSSTVDFSFFHCFTTPKISELLLFGSCLFLCMNTSTLEDNPSLPSCPSLTPHPNLGTGSPHSTQTVPSALGGSVSRRCVYLTLPVSKLLEARNYFYDTQHRAWYIIVIQNIFTSQNLAQVSCVGEKKNLCFLKMFMNGPHLALFTYGCTAPKRTPLTAQQTKEKRGKAKDEVPAQLYSSLTACFRAGNKDFLPIQMALYLWKLIHRHAERHAQRMS